MIVSCLCLQLSRCLYEVQIGRSVTLVEMLMKFGLGITVDALYVLLYSLTKALFCLTYVGVALGALCVVNDEGG